jgi:hypothetical protein
MMKNGHEIEYTWEEIAPEKGYTLIDYTPNGKVTTLTNKRKIEKTNITVKKVWDDQNNAAKVRKPIQVQLYANNKAVGDPVTLNEANNWSYTWTKQNKNYNPTGASGKQETIKYTVDELVIPEGYTKTITGNATSFTITNTFVPGKLEIEKKFQIVPPEENEEEGPLVDIPIIKEWDDEEHLAEYATTGTPQYERMVEEIRRRLNLDSLKYTTIETLVKSIGIPQEDICLHCFNGSSAFTLEEENR